MNLRTRCVMALNKGVLTTLAARKRLAVEPLITILQHFFELVDSGILILFLGVQLRKNDNLQKERKKPQSVRYGVINY